MNMKYRRKMNFTYYIIHDQFHIYEICMKYK